MSAESDAIDTLASAVGDLVPIKPTGDLTHQEEMLARIGEAIAHLASGVHRIATALEDANG